MRIAFMEHAAGLGHPWGRSNIGFRCLCQLPQCAWTQHDFAVVYRATEIPWATYDGEISPGFHGKSLFLDENRARTGDRWWLEVRPDQIRSGLFRSIARACAGPERCQYLCGRLFVQR